MSNYEKIDNIETVSSREPIDCVYLERLLCWLSDAILLLDIEWMDDGCNKIILSFNDGFGVAINSDGVTVSPKQIALLLKWRIESVINSRKEPAVSAAASPANLTLMLWMGKSIFCLNSYCFNIIIL